ncbi:uncharacterized protein VTP21DRAFT_2187 [Calcarisporiella thermophila]|uniref:uncharacterized protein n=1 Tax=Calcarisporiella thermophila TaxID=911321 RepID=UPI0037435EC7
MDLVGYSYAGIVFVGGVIGYLKAGSAASLASGVIFGSLIGYSARLTSQNPRQAHMAFALSVLLLVIMGLRFSKSGKFMPAGLVAILSLVMSIRYGMRLAA